MTATDATHRCPADGCEERVPTEMLMCRGHWYMVPKPMRDAVWGAYRGPGPGSDAHTAAIFAAIGAVNAKLGEQS